ncbi:GMC family oxidoreductase [Croceicoccus sp. YJ47]|uniref:GMC family oxidoreductase n=1 Tax=Croceicoccus sp. YJ47 TaxID=2798724 RepID=UPI00192276FB|nr:GMC family oxidoreductase N-terminal domain-containing protein [Croceicoccus sp. YJ47]QQN73406.1 GMC family oxidoreductase N-terminal domain-containing protein [Croceicoccus sp. YJ47]
MAEMWDYIVVGAGSSGCVLAEKLSADGRSSVLVLEAGGEPSFWNHVPKGVAKLVKDPAKIWLYKVTQPRDYVGTDGDDDAGGEFWIRGKGLGGSSGVNGMIWSRGEPADYDAWEREHGAAGWNGAAMTDAFRALEDHADGASDTRGAGGPVHVDPQIYTYPLAEDMIAAGETLGLERVRDLNGSTGRRVGYYTHNIKDGVRQSAAKTFLEPARRRPNVRVVTGALAQRIVMENGRAVGIEAKVNGRAKRFDCAGEIIGSAGAMESPLLLQRSGIGDPERLVRAGVDPVVAAPDVGERMIEHLSLSMPFRLDEGKGTHHHFFGLGLMRAMARWAMRRDGIMATGPFEVGAFDNVHHPDGRTDAQFYLGAYSFAVGGDNDPVPLDKIDRRPGLTIYGSLLRLTSEGSLRITGPDADDAPKIEPNFLTTEHDRQSAVAMVRRMREFVHAPPLGQSVGCEEIPGDEVESDAAILAAFRRLSSCGLHGIGTCRMGSGDRAVVDPRLRVNGVDGLRVVDCSVIPGHVTGNTNAPAMAIGLRAAALILSDRP